MRFSQAKAMVPVVFATSLAACSLPPATPAPTSQVSRSDLLDANEDDRALERTLVQTGGLLLPPYVMEVVPYVTYTNNGNDGMRITDGGALASADVRLDSAEFGVTGRVGLPWDFQAEITLPYVLAHQTTSLDGIATSDQRGNGVGDIQLALRHQLVNAHDWVPNILAGVEWKSASGDSASSSTKLATGSGYESVTANVTFVKTQDPLVFVGTLGYTNTLSARINGLDVDPGNSYQVKFGTVLAVSPESSLRVALDNNFISKTSVDSRHVAGSDRVSSVLELGLGTSLNRHVLLDVQVGIGITQDAPDLQIGMALAYRL